MGCLHTTPSPALRPGHPGLCLLSCRTRPVQDGRECSLALCGIIPYNPVQEYDAWVRRTVGSSRAWATGVRPFCRRLPAAGLLGVVFGDRRFRFPANDPLTHPASPDAHASAYGDSHPTLHPRRFSHGHPGGDAHPAGASPHLHPHGDAFGHSDAAPHCDRHFSSSRNAYLDHHHSHCNPNPHRHPCQNTHSHRDASLASAKPFPPCDAPLRTTAHL